MPRLVLAPGCEKPLAATGFPRPKALTSSETPRLRTFEIQSLTDDGPTQKTIQTILVLLDEAPNRAIAFACRRDSAARDDDPGRVGATDDRPERRVPGVRPSAPLAAAHPGLVACENGVTPKALYNPVARVMPHLFNTFGVCVFDGMQPRVRGCAATLILEFNRFAVGANEIAQLQNVRCRILFLKFAIGDLASFERS